TSEQDEETESFSRRPGSGLLTCETNNGFGESVYSRYMQGPDRRKESMRTLSSKPICPIVAVLLISLQPTLSGGQGGPVMSKRRDWNPVKPLSNRCVDIGGDLV